MRNMVTLKRKIIAFLLTLFMRRPNVRDIMKKKSIKTENTPLKVLKKWLDYAKNVEWEKMIDLCQPTWTDGMTEEQITDFLASIYGLYTIIKWTKIEQIENASCRKRFKVEIETTEGLFLMRPNVICEIGPFKPSAKGTWGINPISAMLIKMKDKK